jgi:hypothetical protein
MAHIHSAFLAMCDLKNGACAMDGAAAVVCLPHAQPCPAKPAFGYVDNSTGTVQPYLDLVKAYGWANYVPDQPGVQLPGASIPVWSDIGSVGG